MYHLHIENHNQLVFLRDAVQNWLDESAEIYYQTGHQNRQTTINVGYIRRIHTKLEHLLVDNEYPQHIELLHCVLVSMHTAIADYTTDLYEGILEHVDQDRRDGITGDTVSPMMDNVMVGTILEERVAAIIRKL